MLALAFCEIDILVLYVATIITFDTLDIHLDESL